MAAEMHDDRALIFGEIAGGETVNWSVRAELAEIGEASELPFVEVVPVVARPRVYMETRWTLSVDRSAQVVSGDVSEELSLDPFERTLRDYEGYSHVFGFSGPVELFDNPWEITQY